ncbi:hypothetical protein [Bordetella bronchiseptica]|uniref:hypothetical protein n=1 Tax=Bordetella bronchiseptica TaxID=518 RepID=UPI000FD7AC9F|nr:hypothetical protein [Bordetella bronchiseptica]
MTPIKYDAEGRVMVDSAGAVVAWVNGLPLTADGSLAVSGSVPVAFVGAAPNDGERVTVAV